MAPGDPNIDPLEFDPRSPFGPKRCLVYRLAGEPDIDDLPLAQTPGFRRAQAKHMYLRLPVQLADNNGGLGRAHIKADDQVPACHCFSPTGCWYEAVMFMASSRFQSIRMLCRLVARSVSSPHSEREFLVGPRRRAPLSGRPVSLQGFPAGQTVFRFRQPW